jgi:hypothetical protein
MKRIIGSVGILIVVASLAPGLSSFTRAGEPCGTCGPCKKTAAGDETPYGDLGCGPRYCGEKHEPSCPDPCDGCGRWRGCNGVRQGPEKLAPWQLPPGRGFRSGADVGYAAAPCGGCQACGPRWPSFF